MNTDTLTLSPAQLARFWSRVGRDGPQRPPLETKCWTWSGAVDRGGYGRLGHRIASRISYALHRGPIPAGMFVLHRCDNPPCANPDHLTLGTDAANKADMVAKGRQATGVRHGHARLTPADVTEIRVCYERDRTSQAELAARFGVTQTAVGSILRGEHWQTVPGGDAITLRDVKLTESQAREILSRYRAGGVAMRALGREYGVGAPTVCHIVNGVTWPHLAGSSAA